MAGTLAEIDEKIAKISEEAEEERKADADKTKEVGDIIKPDTKAKKVDPTPKVGQVLTECPNGACRKKQRHGDEYGIVATRYLVFMGPNQPPVVSLLKIACPFCGMESFRGKDLLQLREKARESKNLVVVPQVPSTVHKKDN